MAYSSDAEMARVHEKGLFLDCLANKSQCCQKPRCLLRVPGIDEVATWPSCAPSYIISDLESSGSGAGAAPVDKLASSPESFDTAKVCLSAPRQQWI